MLALEDRADPVALLGSLVSAGDDQRTTVIFDAAGSSSEGVYVAGARAPTPRPTWSPSWTGSASWATSRLPDRRCEFTG